MNLKGKRFENSRLAMEIFVYDVDGKEMFVGRDIAEILGYSNPSTAISENVKTLQKKKVYVKTIENTGYSEIPKNANINMITEIGLYQLVMRSNLSSAEEFQQGVFSEVLPSLRKTNSYVDEEHITKEQYESLRETLMIVCESGKIGLPKASMKIFGNKDELNKRLTNLKLIDRANCTWKEDFACKDKKSGEEYPVFVCDMKGSYEDGMVSKVLQVSLTNYGFVYFKELFKHNPNLGLLKSSEKTTESLAQWSVK